MSGQERRAVPMSESLCWRCAHGSKIIVQRIIANSGPPSPLAMPGQQHRPQTLVGQGPIAACDRWSFVHGDTVLSCRGFRPVTQPGDDQRVAVVHHEDGGRVPTPFALLRAGDRFTISAKGDHLYGEGDVMWVADEDGREDDDGLAFVTCHKEGDEGDEGEQSIPEKG